MFERWRKKEDDDQPQIEEDTLTQYCHQYAELRKSVEEGERLHRQIIGDEIEVELTFYHNIVNAREKVLESERYQNMYEIGRRGIDAAMHSFDLNKQQILSLVAGETAQSYTGLKRKFSQRQYMYNEGLDRDELIVGRYNLDEVVALAIATLRQPYMHDTGLDIYNLKRRVKERRESIDLKAIKTATAVEALYLEEIQAIINGNSGTAENLTDMLEIVTEHRIPMKDTIEELTKAVNGDFLDEDTAAEIRARLQAELDAGAANRHVEL